MEAGLVGVIIAIAIAVVGATPGILSFYSQRKKDKVEEQKAQAEIADLLTEAAAMLIEPLKDRVVDLESVVAKQETRLETQKDKLDLYEERFKKYAKMQYGLCSGIRLLISQLNQLGHEPAFVLDEEYCEEFSGCIE
jgi:uncharacterized protein HemX